MPAQFTFDQLQSWAKEEVDKAVGFARANSKTASEKEIEAYGHGVRQGYLRAVADLELHGAIALKRS